MDIRGLERENRVPSALRNLGTHSETHTNRFGKFREWKGTASAVPNKLAELIGFSR
jgi:hypothetical protein